MLPAGEAALHSVITRLRQELQVVTQQLGAARSENGDLLRRLHLRRQRGRGEGEYDETASSSSASSCSSSEEESSSSRTSPSPRSRRGRSVGDTDLASRVFMSRVGVQMTHSDAVDGRSPERHDTALGAVSWSQWRASLQFPIAYVPPIDFLPEVFVDEYIDVLRIIDKYAQLFHRCHVGGGVALRDPKLFSDTDAARSTAELQEQKIIQLEGLLAAEQAKHAELQHKHELLTKRFSQLQTFGVASGLESAAALRLEGGGMSSAAAGDISVMRRRPLPHGLHHITAHTPAAGDGWDSDRSSAGDDGGTIGTTGGTTSRRGSRHKMYLADRPRKPTQLASGTFPPPAATAKGLSPFPLLEPWHRIVDS